MQWVPVSGLRRNRCAAGYCNVCVLAIHADNLFPPFFQRSPPLSLSLSFSLSFFLPRETRVQAAVVRFLRIPRERNLLRKNTACAPRFRLSRKVASWPRYCLELMASEITSCWRIFSWEWACPTTSWNGWVGCLRERSLVVGCTAENTFTFSTRSHFQNKTVSHQVSIVKCVLWIYY